MILVSGGSGLIGSHLLRELSKGDTPVRALYRKPSSVDKCKKVFEAFNEGAFFEKIEWNQADILDIPALEKAYQGVNRVYHSAALVSFKNKDQSELFDVNIQGTANMVNLALKAGVQKFCFVSSVAAIGKHRDQKCSDEDALWQKTEDTSDYAVSKFYAENEVWRASAEGLPIVIVNPSTVIGYGNWHNSSNTLFKKVDEGLPFYPPGSNGFVAVEDVVECMVKLMNSEIRDQRFILSGENLSYRKLFSSIAKGLSKKPPKYRLSKWQALIYLYFERIIALLGIKHSELSRANIRTAFSERCYNNDKVKEVLEIKFQRIEEAAKNCGVLYNRFN